MKIILRPFSFQTNTIPTLSPEKSPLVSKSSHPARFMLRKQVKGLHMFKRKPKPKKTPPRWKTGFNGSRKIAIPSTSPQQRQPLWSFFF
jgi:hypothetical protein